MRLFKYLVKRLLVFIPLFFGVTFVTFMLIRLLPGSPAQALLGTMATEESIRALEAEMGLDRPLLEQFVIYVKNVLHGDLGYSWFTSSNVTDDLATRFPATFELIFLSILFALAVGVTLAVLSARRPKGIAARIASVYGMLAGAFADFWLALMLIFIFFTTLGWAVSPMGRLDLIMSAPRRISGMYVLDSLLTGNMMTLKSSAAHLLLPVATLGFVNGATILKMTSSTMQEILDSDFIHHSHMLGLSEFKIMGYALKNALPAVVMTVGNMFSFLLGGAVLIEKVFAWGGLGQYVTTALANKDYSAVQGFVLVSTLFAMVVYLIIDLIQMAIDPRIKF
ncbi:MAG: ABC transporter permease [Lachnospiraceae bacterium]|nr:ABC transporter permease [Lachnospiraceae bacterium]